MPAPAISILIPCFNGSATLPDVLDAIGRQTVDFAFETVAVDSGSSDGTTAILRGRVDRLIEIPPDSFDHGLTRNRGVESCRGDLVVLLVQDAVPATGQWLSSLTLPLRRDSDLAGTWARQIPRPDASPITRYYLEHSIASSDAARASKGLSEDELRALDPWQRVKLCSFDNVCSCLRRAVWQRHPFAATAIAEDVQWARDVLLAGHGLEYVPHATVIHSHERSVRYELGRTYLVHERLRSLFGLRTIPTVGSLAQAVAVSAAIHMRCLAARGRLTPRAVLRGLGLAIAFPLGQYLGARSADTGRRYLRPKGV